MDAVAQGVDRWQVMLLGEILQQQGHRRVVDVLRGEPEVDELLGRTEAERVQLFLEPVFHGLHIVVGGTFDGFHGAGVRLGERCNALGQIVQPGGSDILQLRQRDLAEEAEPVEFHQKAVADQCQFREPGGQRRCARTIAPVDRGDGCERVKFHARQK